MAFRFRQSIRLAPGVRLNLGKTGLSVSAGVRGASVTAGKRGIYGNVGAPGTGLSVRKRLDKPAAREARAGKQPPAENSGPFTATLSLDDKGSVKITRGEGGDILSRTEVRMLWEQKGEEVRGWLLEQCADINGDVDALINVHHGSPNPNNSPRYTPIRFPEAPPSRPLEPELPDAPTAPRRRRLPLSARVFKKRRDKFDAEIGAAENDYELTKAAWEQEVQNITETHRRNQQAWEVARLDWYKRFKMHEAAEAERKNNFPELIREDHSTMMVVLNATLRSLIWPRETLIAYEIREGGRVIWLDVDLPEIEDLPTKVATVAASGRKLNIKDKSQKQLRTEYASHIHGITLKIAATVFATLPAAADVIVSGYSQRLDRSTGTVNDDYLVSVKYSRDGIGDINFNAMDRVDAVAVVERFEHRRRMTTTGIFKPIEPLEPDH